MKDKASWLHKLLSFFLPEPTPRERHLAKQIRKMYEQADKDGYEIVVTNRGGISKVKKVEESEE